MKNIKIIYKILNEIKFNVFCEKECCYHKYDDCNRCFEWDDEEAYGKYEHNDCDTCKESDENCDKSYCDCKNCSEKECLQEVEIIRNIVNIFLEENFCTKELCDCYKNCNSISLLDLLMITLYDIEENTCCEKNYGYLLQIDKLECILKNLKSLLCQLKCLSIKDCDLISKALCLLFKIIDLIESIISKINNIECICKSHLCCKCELIECMVCELEDEINCLEKTVAELAYIVFEITSKEILNCTTCGVTECIKDKKRDYLNKYCKARHFRDEEACNKKY